MRAKKGPKPAAPPSVKSNGVVKKRSRRRKGKKDMKSVGEKVLGSIEGMEVALPAAAAPTPASPQTKKPKRKRIRKNKNKSQESPHSGINGISSNSSESQVKNVDVPLEETPGTSPLKTGSTQPSSNNTPNSPTKDKKARKRNRGKRQAPEGKAGGTHTPPDAQKASTTPQTKEEEERRTVFVGNVSTKTNRKGLSRFFSKYGKVETVRLRCAAVPTPGTTKKQAVITNTFHEKRSSINAYVRFTEEAMAEAALQANGAELDNKHLNVDTSHTKTNRNTKKAVFIGNLAFEAEEETLRSHFGGCGEIDSVRIVRDKKLASGKGFGYVNFLTEDAVEMALQLNGQVFMHRQLRVERCTKQGRKARSRPVLKTKKKKGLSFMKPEGVKTKGKKGVSSNQTKKQQSFSGKKMMETKKFKKMKAKAKFSKEDRKKKAIAHKLAGGPAKTVPPP